MKQACPRNGDFRIADLSKRRCKDRSLLISLLLLVSSVVTVSADPIIIGSKKFTESYVLAEIAKRSLENAGIKADHRQGMGGTIILWEALRGGGIDVYPEYTGTIAEEMLKQPGVSTTQIRNALSAQGIGMTDDLGFNNTYALVMRRDHADQLAIRTISDLRAHPELKFGLTHEFLERHDGWRPLSARYQLAPAHVLGIDHALGYSALAKGEIDVKDAYSTDAKIGDYGLVTLIDDLRFFPQYKAVFLYRKTLSPDVAHALNDLSNSIDEARMIRLNSEAERTKNYAAAAQQFFGTTETASPFVSETLRSKLLRWITRGATGARVSKIQPSDEKADGRFTLDVEFAVPLYAQLTGKLLLFRPAIVSRRETVFLTEKTRKHPIVLESESQLETARIKLPDGFVVDELPDAVELKLIDPAKSDTPCGVYAVSYEAKDGYLLSTRKLVLRATILPVEQYQAAQKFFEGIRSAELARAVLIKK